MTSTTQTKFEKLAINNRVDSAKLLLSLQNKTIIDWAYKLVLRL